ncbi:MAG: NTP transferase domain-containing protein [Verrucomicrobiota bacterium]
MNTSPQLSYHGIVLAGGGSERMGSDKALINYHGIPQWQWCTELLKHFCHKIFVSKNESQPWNTGTSATAVIDNEWSPGPFHPWSRLHRIKSRSYWIILTCDIPFITKKAISDLIRDLENQHSTFDAAAYFAAGSAFPDPQLALLSPEACLKASEAYAAGQRSPKRFLEQIETLLKKPTDLSWLNACNTREQCEQAQNYLKQNNPQGDSS